MMDDVEQVVARMSPTMIEAVRATGGKYRWIVERRAGGGRAFEGYRTWLGADWAAFSYETFNLSTFAEGAIVHGPFSRSIRAALSSAIGEPYEFSGWVEVVEEDRGR